MLVGWECVGFELDSYWHNTGIVLGGLQVWEENILLERTR